MEDFSAAAEFYAGAGQSRGAGTQTTDSAGDFRAAMTAYAEAGIAPPEILRVVQMDWLRLLNRTQPNSSPGLTSNEATLLSEALRKILVSTSTTKSTEVVQFRIMLDQVLQGSTTQMTATHNERR